MADSPLVSKFGGKKRTPKFEDEGPPADDSPRGAGGSDYEPDSDDAGGPPDMDADDSGGMPDADADPEQKSVDDMCDILGVGPEDREDFANALKTYVSSCLASSMAPPDDMGAMPMPGGPPAQPEV